MRKTLLSLAFLVTLCAGGWTKTITASGGSASAVQSAIDTATTGDTVVIPVGNYTWSAAVSTKGKAIHLNGSGSTITNTHMQGGLLLVTPTATGNVDIFGLKFLEGGSGSTEGRRHLWVYYVAGAKPILVHDCEFSTGSFGFRQVEWQQNGGVIYNCKFVSRDKGDIACIAFKNPSATPSWKTASSLGMADTGGDKNTYLEDCTFKDCFIGALDFDDNSRTVVRHNKFDNSGMSSHGWDTSPFGVRQFEIYDNDFIFTVGPDPCNPNPYPLNLNWWYYVRGGTGVIFNNAMPKISSCAWGTKGSITMTVYSIRRASQTPGCITSYPAPHQVGFGSDAAGREISDPVYIWGNTGTGANEIGTSDYNPDDCGNNQHASDYIRLNRDYFLAEKPNYEPYTYPHPLRSGGGTGPNPTPSPNPSPSVTPAPTASPTPGASYEQWIQKQNDWIRANPPEPDKSR